MVVMVGKRWVEGKIGRLHKVLDTPNLAASER
jgi:hypothetical protein